MYVPRVVASFDTGPKLPVDTRGFILIQRERKTAPKEKLGPAKFNLIHLC